ncbi:MAG: sodium/proton-translocating pyrophosphatase [Oscillospiraceae bacterium]|nr:sodium/proton-translocating pyrophosphatase [Oscillospiraceae bacterium]
MYCSVSSNKKSVICLNIIYYLCGHTCVPALFILLAGKIPVLLSNYQCLVCFLTKGVYFLTIIAFFVTLLYNISENVIFPVFGEYTCIKLIQVAAVTGDTVGDTRKDVVGVALDIFIKMMSTVANTLVTVIPNFTILKF